MRKLTRQAQLNDYQKKAVEIYTEAAGKEPDDYIMNCYIEKENFAIYNSMHDWAFEEVEAFGASGDLLDFLDECGAIDYIADYYTDDDCYITEGAVLILYA